MTFVLAEVTERRKQAWRGAVRAVWECARRSRLGGERRHVES